ncbi:MAG TPA: ATP-dependent Clp protease proteolytic subunit [Candidatus Thermoplasmatota archaeon]|nr:ATP-dependent Clp protease proteolytic subunit [Candidatus Thermoplasmatota archaeon]
MPDKDLDHFSSQPEADEGLCAALNAALPAGTGAICFIAPYQGERLSPTRIAYAQINIRDELAMEEAIQALVAAKTKKVILLLNTPGGGVSSSFKIARALRESFKEITVLVPHIAASGGTLLAMTGDKIVMGMMSHLTPIDVQVPRGESTVSVNSMMRVFERLNKIFETTAEEDAPYPIKAMADKLDPVEFQEWVDVSRLMIEHADDVLELNPALKDKRQTIINRLTRNLPSHSYAIVLPEAKDIFGPTVVLSPEEWGNLPLWKAASAWLRHYVLEEASRHIIHYHLPPKETKTNHAPEPTQIPAAIAR